MTETASEEAITFACDGESLVGILHPAPGRRGVLVVVGGPQYRVGSHRQFTLLARRLAAEGVPAMRFDSRGLGDSGGRRAGFEHLSADIDAAVSEFLHRLQTLEEVVIWGLCDAASAALLHPRLPPAVSGLALLNPWITEQQVAPQTMLRHYYLRRAVSPAFWRKLLAGGVRGGKSSREVASALSGAWKSRRREEPDASLSGRMVRGLERFPGPVLLITSGQDLTAGEFLDAARQDRRWRAQLAAPRLRHEHLTDANHTFSRAGWRDRVESLTLEWLQQW